jgi:pimeloyl-ACP methyl ester carboxylesterase
MRSAGGRRRSERPRVHRGPFRSPCPTAGDGSLMTRGRPGLGPPCMTPSTHSSRIRPANDSETSRNGRMAGAPNCQVSGAIRLSTQVAKSCPRTLSRWRHGFKSRWDYKAKGAGQGTSPEPTGRLSRGSRPRWRLSEREREHSTRSALSRGAARGRGDAQADHRRDPASRAAVADVPAKLGSKRALIVWGMKDPGFRPSMIPRVRGAFDNPAVIELPHAKHYIQEDAPAEIAEAIADRFG